MGTLACFTKRTLHLFDGLNPYADQATLRYHAFRAMNWDVAYFDAEEWEEDEYDASPRAIHFVYYDEHNNALGSCRLLPTDQKFVMSGQHKTFMLKDVFNGIKNDQLLYINEQFKIGSNVLEGTRFTIAPHLRTPEKKKERNDVISQITLGVVEFCYSTGIDKVIGVMPPKVWKSIWESRGCPTTFLGSSVTLKGEETVQAGELEVSEFVVQQMRQATRLSKLSLCFGKDVEDLKYQKSFMHEQPLPQASHFAVGNLQR